MVSNSLTILGAHADLIGDGSDGLPPSRASVTQLYFQRLRTGTFRTADLIEGRRSPLDAVDVYHRLRDDGPPTGGICFDWSDPN